jgi:thiol-disulfide isomerase/thioredoxin
MQWIRVSVILIFIVVLVACTTQESAETTATQPTAEPEVIVAEKEQTVPAPITPSPTQTPIPSLPILYAAPPIDNEIWINNDAGQSLAALRGKVVLVEFWTFGCINCKRVIPYMNEWYADYAGEDFEILSVHYPEFSYERDVENVRNAVAEYEIEFPVAIDNNRLTWAAWNQRYWPTRYLVDRAGNVRFMHIGEGAYPETAALIEQLIAE